MNIHKNVSMIPGLGYPVMRPRKPPTDDQIVERVGLHKKARRGTHMSPLLDRSA